MSSCHSLRPTEANAFINAFSWAAVKTYRTEMIHTNYSNAKMTKQNDSHQPDNADLVYFASHSFTRAFIHFRSSSHCHFNLRIVYPHGVSCCVRTDIAKICGDIHTQHTLVNRKCTYRMFYLTFNGSVVLVLQVPVWILESARSSMQKVCAKNIFVMQK